MARVLGVDIGSARVGLAISDPVGVTAQPLEVLSMDGVEEPVDAVASRARELGAEAIVVGIPFRMDGSRGPEAESAEAFARELEDRTGLPVARWDERLSTVEAERTMRAAGQSARRQRGVVDKVAAAIILQSYLEAKAPR